MAEQVIQLTTRLIEQTQGFKEYHIAEQTPSGSRDVVTIGVTSTTVFDETLFLQGLGMILASIQKARFNSPAV